MLTFQLVYFLSQSLRVTKTIDVYLKLDSCITLFNLGKKQDVPVNLNVFDRFCVKNGRIICFGVVMSILFKKF